MLNHKKIILFFLFTTICNGQYTLTHDGLVREYYVSYPEDANEPCPLIINMHGFGSNALDQQSYSEMDDIALDQNIVVVYPEGINNAWNVGANWDATSADDIGFISSLIDSVAEDFNIDLDRVYACGMSNGGYMAYELACELSDKIAAFGSVTGNFLLNTDQTCVDSREIPIIHFHGTNDLVVPYFYSWDASMFVEEAIEYWRNVNNLDSVLVESISDFDSTDNTTVEKFTYYNTVSATQFIHFKVISGGHQWFGSSIADWFIYSLGYNNHDINTNEELIDFFLNYRLSDFLSTEIIEENLPADFILHQNYPNPFNPSTAIRFELKDNSLVNISIYDLLGKRVKKLLEDELVSGTHEIIWDGRNELGIKAPSGIYIFQMESKGLRKTHKGLLLK